METRPQKVKPHHKLRPLTPRIKLLLLIAVVAVIAVIYAVVDPAERFMPKCLVHELTGYQCPGCGSQRMLHALLHGDLQSAWHFNPALLVSLPLILAMVVLEIYRTRFPRLYAALYSLPSVIVMITAIIVWTIVRNL